MSIFSLTGLFITLTASVLLIFLLIFGRTKLHRIWTLFNFSVFTWGIGCFLAGKSSSPWEALFGWRIAISGGLFIGLFFYHTIYVFTEIKKKKTLIIIYIQAILFFLLTIFTETTLSGWHLMFKSLYYPSSTIPYLIMISSWTIVVLIGYRELIAFLKKAKGTRHIKARYFLIAFLPGFIGGGPTLLPALGINIYPYANFGVALYAIIGTYAILRYRLVDIDEAVALTIVFTMICIPILAIPFILGYITKSWILCGVVATTLAPTALYLYNRAKGRVLTERLAFQEAVTSIAEDIKHVRTLDELVKILANQIQKRLKLSYVGLYLSNQGSGQYALKGSEAHKSYKDAPGDENFLTKDKAVIKLLMKEKEPILRDEIALRFYNTDPGTVKEAEMEMQSIGAALTMPIFYEENGNQELMAIVALGERLSYKPYGENEIKTLKSLSNHIALAIKNAEYIEETKRIHAQLLQVQKRQQQSDHMLSLAYMVTNLSHELRNPLNIIKGAAINTLDSIEFELKDLPPGEKYEKLFSYIKGSLADIEHTTTKSTDMLNAILNTLRIDKDKFTDLDIKDVINDSIKRASIEIKGTKIKLKNNIPDGFTKVKGDHTTLELMSFNLIHNAVQAMLRSNKGDKVELIAKDLPDRVQIEFSDNGPGIAQKDIERIFEPFYTTKGNLFKYETGQSKGVGLGLMIAYQVVTAHGGIIYVKSKEGEGASFFVELPKKGGTLHGEEQKAIDSR